MDFTVCLHNCIIVRGGGAINNLDVASSSSLAKLNIKKKCK